MDFVVTDSYNWSRMMLGADFGISHSLLTESTASEIHPTTFDGKVKPNFIYKHEIRYSSSDSYNLAKSQVRSRFRTFDLEKCFCHEILHRYSAPGFYQRISDAKVRAVCVHAFHSFHRLCFYIFFASENQFDKFRGT